MSDRIVTGIYAQVSGQDQIFNYLLTDGAYHDPSLASQIVGGVARIAIASDATFDITESISFQPQGGSSGTSIGQIPIINDDGFFDSWARRTIAGMDWTVKRGYADQPWSEWVTIFAGRGRGRPEFSGQRIIVTLTDRFGYMREPVAQAVFDDATANESLRNTTAPMVFGEAYQVRPALADPNILAYFSADNLAQVYSTSEGGNPATPQWVRLPQGVQLTASPSLVITTDIAGPPSENPDESSDVLGGQGQFEDWAGGELDYPDTTVSTTVDASLTEGPNSSTGVLEVQASQSFDTGFVSGTNTQISNQEVRANELGLSIPPGAIITGIEVTATARWQQVSGTTIANEFVRSLGYVLPNGLTFGAQPSPNELNETSASYSVGGQFDLLGVGSGVLTAEDLNSDDFRIRIDARVFSGQNLVVSSLQIKIYYVTEEQYVRLTWADVLEAGTRYTISVETVGGVGDSVLADWEASVDVDDPQSARSAMMAGTNVHEYVFTAGMTDLDLFFYRGSGNGDQEINSIVIRKGSSAVTSYKDLIRYLHTTAGEDPDLVCDNDSLELVQAQADDPRLGWYVSDQTTREQLSTFLSHSLSAVTWGGIDGKWKAAQLRIPTRPGGDYLRAVNSFSEPSAVPDYGDDLRDRVHSAKNFYPIPESEAAGVTANWDRDQREQILAEWRITERADPDNIVEYSSPIELTVTDIQPKWGLATGGTEVTISGTGFVFGAEVVIGGAQATSVDVQSSEKIVAVTPAGTVGPVPVVVNSGGETYAMAGEFEYTDEPRDTPGQGVIFRASFEDASGRDPLATALLDRLSARKLAGHNVLCYEYPPMMAEKTTPVDLQDYDLVTPGRMIWVQDEYDPLFKMGRWAQIQSRTFGSNPVEVRLGVRISDHPESFKEFPGDIPILTEAGQPIITEDGQSILFG